MSGNGHELSTKDEIAVLRAALSKPLQDTILDVLESVPAGSDPAQVAVVIEGRVRERQTASS